MTQEEYRAAMQDVVYLCACMVNGESPDTMRAAAMDLERLYQAADRHLLTGIVGYALEASGVRDPVFLRAEARAVRKCILFDVERVGVLKALDEAGIWHMPLKGSVLKELYPKPGMREFADNDILYDVSRSAEVRDIMESLGFETVQYVQNQYNHDHYNKAPVLNFEMHRALFPPSVEDSLFIYYEHVKDRLIKDKDNACGYHFIDEDFYLYMIAHEYKHYTGGGTGLRSLLDAYVYLRAKEKTLDWSYIAGELDKLGIADFEARNRSLALHLFSGGELTAQDREMLEYILASGTYGTIGHQVKNSMKKNGWGKLQYMAHRFFVPVRRSDPRYEAFAAAYPRFYKTKLLLPLLPLWRTARALRSGRFQAEAEAVKKA